jgi:hypothetical protein
MKDSTMTDQNTPDGVSKDKAGITVSRTTYYILGGIIAALIIGHCYYTLVHIPTKDAYARRVTATLNEAMANDPDNVFFKAVERAHVSVTAKSGKVTGCDVQTIDGRNTVGSDGSNLSSVKIQVTVYWDGVLHSNGRTVMEFVYDFPRQRFIPGEIVETDAFVNITDPNWWGGVASIVGTLIAILDQL